jgi:hypothetical protein
MKSRRESAELDAQYIVSVTQLASRGDGWRIHCEGKTMSTSEPHPQAGVVGFQLSALRAYGTEAGTIEGVGFWPRAAARVIDLLAHILVRFCAGCRFTIVQMIAAGGHADDCLS